MLHWEKNRVISLESPLKLSGTLTISGFNDAHGPRLAASSTHGPRGSGGPGSGGYQGGAHLWGMGGGGGGPLGGCGLLGGWLGTWGTFDSPAPSLLIVAAKSLDGPCEPGGPYPQGYA